MSLESLEQDGILLPREEWGTADLHTTVNKPRLIALGVAAAVSCALMLWGDGNAWTWAGLVLFLADLFAFTWFSVLAIQKQSQRRGEQP
jgi:hypothetical protein